MIVTSFLYGPSIETREQMLRLILQELDFQTKEGDVAYEFEQLRRWHEEYPNLLLTVIVDEFPDISEDALEIVRSLVDLEGIVLILNGCKEDLMDFVGEKAPALMERKRHVFELDPMDSEEVRELLLFRMAWAKEGDYNDRDIEPFTDGAIEKIHEGSDGIPRRALKLAGDSVYNAIEKDKFTITPDLVYERDGDRTEEKKNFWSFLPFVD